MTQHFRWTDAAVREALGLPTDPATASTLFTGISTDTRKLEGGELFVPLVGIRDGHDFLRTAVDNGATGAVVSASVSVPTDLPLVLYRVPDTLVALGALARYGRRALPARVIGITGSSGKTSVKELLAGALTTTFRVHATLENENNRIGVPLTLLAAPEDAEVIVLEMGTNEPGEIAALSVVAEPDAAILTTVSEAHLERLGTFEGVLEEKLDLLRGARPGAPLLVGDHPYALVTGARALRPEVKSVGFSTASDPDLRGELLGPDAIGRYTVRALGEVFTAPLPGRHGAQNALLALVMAHELGASVSDAIDGMTGVTPETDSLRTEIRRVGGLTLLLDCYNANPQSTAAALELLSEMAVEDGRVAFLATMLELGDRSSALHREILERALNLPLDFVVAVGEYAPHAAEMTLSEGNIPALIAAPSPEAGYRTLRTRLQGSETILLKGSRGMKLETLVPLFERDFGKKNLLAEEGDL
jgi:UDP-N-acetylmuramoyl-tripeptide--D-alanyl-D-alanine ligase